MTIRVTHRDGDRYHEYTEYELVSGGVKVTHVLEDEDWSGYGNNETRKEKILTLEEIPADIKQQLLTEQ